MPAFRPICILALCAAACFASGARAADDTATFTLAEPPSAAAELPESFQTASVKVERAAPTPLVVSAVPEPTSYALMLAGLVALHWVARRRISRPD